MPHSRTSMQQKSIQLLLITPFFSNTLYDRLSPLQHDGCQICGDVMSFFTEYVFSWSLLECLCYSLFSLKQQRFVQVYIFFTFCLLSRVILSVCFGSSSYQNIVYYIYIEYCQSCTGNLVRQYFSVSTDVYKCHFSNMILLVESHIITLPPLCFTVRTMYLLQQSWSDTPNMLKPI